MKIDKHNCVAIMIRAAKVCFPKLAGFLVFMYSLSKYFKKMVHKQGIHVVASQLLPAKN